MKTILLSLMAAALLAAGCSDATTNPTATYYLYADVDGQRFNADELHAVASNNQIVISGEAAGGTRLEIQLKDTDIQEFDLGSDSYNKAFVRIGPSGSNRFETRFHYGEGRVVITRRVATEIMGFFQFTGINQDSQVVKIDKGNFRLRLQR